ncbi:MAG TPA: class I SAM-dependent methyltransferase, partial [Acidobacteriaceae bacterium]|nr:class I SAM-dependent methyltransferase [Acidobacteriaceae bacterium]
LAVRLEANLPAGSDVLEVAPGPGFLSIELAKSGKLHVHALEISNTMVELAVRNAADSHVKVDIQQGNASAMPFAENSFDLLVCRAAFKNFSEPVKALQEMHRVLRPGASGVIIDLRRDTPMSAIREYVNGIGIGTINRWMTLLTFRFMLLKRAYTRQEIEQMLGQVPFRRTEVQQNAIGMEIWFEK